MTPEEETGRYRVFIELANDIDRREYIQSAGRRVFELVDHET